MASHTSEEHPNHRAAPERTCVGLGTLPELSAVLDTDQEQPSAVAEFLLFPPCSSVVLSLSHRDAAQLHVHSPRQ